MATELTAPPDRLTAGTTLRYRRSYSDYPAPTWTLTLHLTGKSVLTPTAAAGDGADHVVTVGAADTAGLASGTYTWTERVSSGGEVYDVASGRLVVAADPATASAGSMQAWEEKALEAVRAAIQGNLAGGMASFQIAGRAVSTYSLEELLRLESQMATRIARRNRRSGSGRQILGSFTTPGFDR